MAILRSLTDVSGVIRNGSILWMPVSQREEGGEEVPGESPPLGGGRRRAQAAIVSLTRALLYVA